MTFAVQALVTVFHPTGQALTLENVTREVLRQWPLDATQAHLAFLRVNDRTDWRVDTADDAVTHLYTKLSCCLYPQGVATPSVRLARHMGRKLLKRLPL